MTASAATAGQKNYDRIVGAEGWEYISRIDSIDEKNAGQVSLAPAELRYWVLGIEQRRAWCQYAGSDYSFIIAPNKASIYPEFLPPELRPSRFRDLPMLKAHLAKYSDAGLLLDPTDRLLAQKATREVYFKTDEHWNAWGAFLAYQMVMEDINTRVDIKAVSEDQLHIRRAPFIGGLEVLSETPKPEYIDVLSVEGATSKQIYVNKTGGRGKAQVFMGSDSHLPTAVMFRDSYGSSMLPFLTATFSRLTVVSHRGLMFDLLKQEKPDVVIHELCERYLDPLPDDLRGRTFEEYCNAPLSELP